MQVALVQDGVALLADLVGLQQDVVASLLHRSQLVHLGLVDRLGIRTRHARLPGRRLLNLFHLRSHTWNVAVRGTTCLSCLSCCSVHLSGQALEKGTELAVQFARQRVLGLARLALLALLALLAASGKK